MIKKHTVKIVNETFFKYNKNCYEHMTENTLNQICQTELRGHRNLFKQNALKAVKKMYWAELMNAPN